MGSKKRDGYTPNPTTRRQVISRLTVTLGSLAMSSSIFAKALLRSPEAPSTAASPEGRSLHQEVEFQAGPQRIFEALLDAQQFAAFTGLPATIDSQAGGAFSMFGGMIVGRNIELVLNQRIVQAWRPTHWDAGIYSIARFELQAQGPGTRLVFDHSSFPEGEARQLGAGWHSDIGSL